MTFMQVLLSVQLVETVLVALLILLLLHKRQKQPQLSEQKLGVATAPERTLTFPAEESRKLTGLYVCIGSLLVLVVIASISIGLLHTGWEIFGAVGTQIATLGGVHQGAQSFSDRSPNYAGGPPLAVQELENAPVKKVYPIPTQETGMLR